MKFILQTAVTMVLVIGAYYFGRNVERDTVIPKQVFVKVPCRSPIVCDGSQCVGSNDGVMIQTNSK